MYVCACMYMCVCVCVCVCIHTRNGMGFPAGSVGKKSACDAGDTGDSSLIPGLGRSPGRGHGNALQYSCLGNPVDRGAWWATVNRVAKSWTRLRRLSMHNGILLSPRKEWNMDGPRDYYTKWGNSERERQIPYDITYTWSIKYDTNKPTDTDSQATVAKGRDVGEGWIWSLGLADGNYYIRDG